ncbi:unnamed protein product, partial [Rotaria magnacalcarata]
MEALNDSDVDDIEEALETIGNTESEEYSDDDVIIQSNSILKPSNTTNSNLTASKITFTQVKAEESEEYSDDENIYPSQLIAAELGHTKRSCEEQWTYVTEENDCRPKCLPDFNETSGPTFTIPTCPVPSDFYNRMLPDSLFQHIVECTNLRAQRHFANTCQKNENSWCEVTCNEMKKFFAMCIHMGMIRKRRIRDYWSTHPLLHTPVFHSKNYLSRNRFFEILRFLRFADYEKMDNNDRLRKLRPFLKTVKDLCLTMYTSRRNVAVDETLLLYKGRISFKQYNPRKRARFGIKTIALCDSTNGFLHNFEVYTGQATNTWAEHFPDAQMLPVLERIVVHLAAHILNKNYCIYADNWFLSVRLVRWMAEHGTTVTGTIKTNR